MDSLRAHRRLASLIGFAGLALLILAGCSTPPPGAPPVSPTRPAAVPADTSDCEVGSLTYELCVSSAKSRAARAHAAAVAEYEVASRQYRADAADHAAAVAESRKSFGDRVDLTFAAGVGLLLYGGFALRHTSASPGGRDPQGPAAGAAAAKAAGDRAGAAMAIPVGAWLLAAWWAGFGSSILVAIPAAGVVWWAAARAHRMGEAASGYQLADQHWREEQAEATEAAQAAWEAERAALGPGRRPVHDPARPVVPEPHMTLDEAIVYGKTGGVGVQSGGAAAVLLDARGEPRPARRAWLAACRTAGLGTTTTDDKGREKFTPSATLIGVTALPGGDARIAVQPTTTAIGEPQLQGMTAVFLRTAGIRRAEDWRRDHTSNVHTLVVSNSPSPASDPTPRTPPGRPAPPSAPPSAPPLPPPPPGGW